MGQRKLLTLRRFKQIFITTAAISILTFVACGTSQNVEAEVVKGESPYSFFENPSDWTFQYPSGTASGGMLISQITDDFKSKYLSLYRDENGVEYLHFSLDASDQGKSKNGSSVRAELRNLTEWKLTQKASLSYSFYVTSTDFKSAKFTVGQFLMHCTEKPSPLCRIEVENGKITAVVVNYKSDGKTKADGKAHRYDLGDIQQNQEVSIKIAVDNKKLTLYRDGSVKATHIFPESVSSDFKNYFKAGIYYQNRDSPKIFSEVFLRNLKVELENPR